MVLEDGRLAREAVGGDDALGPDLLLDDAVEAAAADGMPALALTDLANVFGLVKFYQAARGKGLKPVIGCDVWIENETDRDKPQRLLLLCQSRAGYRNLCELLTRAYRANQYRGRA